jgi:hypothetical protein
MLRWARKSKSLDRGFGYFLGIAATCRANLDDFFRDNISECVLTIYQAKLPKGMLKGTAKNRHLFRAEIAILDQLIDRHLRFPLECHFNLRKVREFDYTKCYLRCGAGTNRHGSGEHVGLKIASVFL